MSNLLDEKENFVAAREMEQKIRKYIDSSSLGAFKPKFDHLPVFSRGQGSRLVDVSGRSYTDFLMGSGALILGHSHPEIVSAVGRQLQRGTTYFWFAEPTVQLAEKIIQAVPCGETVKFCNSGTEGTFNALRMARAHTGKEKILKFEGGYHGCHDYAVMSCWPQDLGSYPAAKPDSAGIPKGVIESVLVAPFNDIETTAKIIDAHEDSIAAVIVEPLQRAIKPEGTFLSELRKLTKKHDIVLIFDEIVTGFRLDYGGAQEHYGVIPDLAVYGKALTGGFSLAAVCGRKDIMNTTDPARMRTPAFSYFSGTLNGNPLAATAGLVCLSKLGKEGVLKAFHERGEHFMEEVRSVGRDCHVPLQVAGDGPVLQMFFTERPVFNYPDTLSNDKAMGLKVARSMLAKGIFLMPNSKIHLSLAHSSEDFERFLEALKEALLSL